MSSTFSPQDVDQITSGPFDHVVAIGHDGTVYRLSRTEETPTAEFLSARFSGVPLDPKSEETARNASTEHRAFWMVDYTWQQIERKRYNEYALGVASGQITNREANILHREEIVTEIASRLSLEYVKVDPPW